MSKSSAEQGSLFDRLRERLTRKLKRIWFSRIEPVDFVPRLMLGTLLAREFASRFEVDIDYPTAKPRRSQTRIALNQATRN